MPGSFYLINYSALRSKEVEFIHYKKKSVGIIKLLLDRKLRCQDDPVLLGT